jgi:hypothetical protein
MNVVNEINKINEIKEKNEKKTSVFLSLNQLAKVLQHDYNFPITLQTLSRYVNEGVVTPDYVLKRKFLFRKDRVPEIVNTLENKFREKRLKQKNQSSTNTKKENNVNEEDLETRLKELFSDFLKK